MIASFRGNYSFLSNFYPAPIRGKSGIVYPTAEHAYQALKSDDLKVRSYVSQLATPALAKKFGKTIQQSSGFARLPVMRKVVRAKFRSSPLANLLLHTGDEPLQEGNVWHDYFWGVCNGKGHNWLGRILMEEREYLRSPR